MSQGTGEQSANHNAEKREQHANCALAQAQTGECRQKQNGEEPNSHADN
jgi:hypothetical protein